MSTHNICFCRERRKILCGYPLLSVAMITCSRRMKGQELKQTNISCKILCMPSKASDQPVHLPQKSKKKFKRIVC